MRPAAPVRPERFTLMSQSHALRGQPSAVRTSTPLRSRPTRRYLAAALALTLVLAWAPGIAASPAAFGDAPHWSLVTWFQGLLAQLGIVSSDGERGESLERITAPEGTAPGAPGPGGPVCDPGMVCSEEGPMIDPDG